jgi:hypothetical protein
MRDNHGVKSGKADRSDEAVVAESDVPTDDANGMLGGARAAVGADAVTAANSSDDVDGMAIADPAGTCIPLAHGHTTKKYISDMTKERAMLRLCVA